MAKLARPFRSAQAERLLDAVRNDAKRVQTCARRLSEHLNNEAARITKEHVEEIQDGVRGLQEHFQGMDAMQQDIREMVNFALASQEGMFQMLSDVVDSKNPTLLCFLLTEN